MKLAINQNLSNKAGETIRTKPRRFTAAAFSAGTLISLWRAEKDDRSVLEKGWRQIRVLSWNYQYKVFSTDRKKHRAKRICMDDFPRRIKDLSRWWQFRKCWERNGISFNLVVRKPKMENTKLKHIKAVQTTSASRRVWLCRWLTEWKKSWRDRAHTSCSSLRL